MTDVHASTHSSGITPRTHRAPARAEWGLPYARVGSGLLTPAVGVAAGDAYPYAEPERAVTSRSGDTCVVALTDQWYITYGEPAWRELVAELTTTSCDMFSGDTRARFAQALAWLHEWACSRQFGLGSRLPFDETQMIESLSDSTLYMAFYTIAHLLPGANSLRPAAAAADVASTHQARNVTDAEWDFIFLGTPLPSAASSGGRSGIFSDRSSCWCD